MKPYEIYHCDCPRCGYPEARDAGPYEPSPLDEGLWPPLDPRVHLMWCGRCGKPFDVIDDEADPWAEGSTATADGWPADVDPFYPEGRER